MSDDRSPRPLRPLFWVRASKKDFDAFPSRVKQIAGYALHLAQTGKRHLNVKTLKGFGGSAVVEIVQEHEGNAFRTVYTVRFEKAVYVLHAFQKKSKTGRETPKTEIELVRRRLADAEDHYRDWLLRELRNDEKGAN